MDTRKDAGKQEILTRPVSHTEQWRGPLEHGIYGRYDHEGKALVVNRQHEDQEYPVVLHMFRAQHAIDLPTADRLSVELQQALKCIHCTVHDDGHNCAVSMDGTCHADRIEKSVPPPKPDMNELQPVVVRDPPAVTWWLLLALVGAAVGVNLLLFLERMGFFK